LLPVTPPTTPYIPSSPANHLELISEDSNSTAAEAKVFENSIMGADALVQLDSNNEYPVFMDTTDVEQHNSVSESYATPRKRKIECLRVEGPLTPPMFSESPAKRLKSVTFSTMVQFIPEVPSTYENGADILSPADDFAGFYEEIKPLAEEANQRIENERLLGADTIKRVNVPYLDFTLPVAPWDKYKRKADGHDTDDTELDAHMKFLLLVKRDFTKSSDSWHGLSKLERELPWEPFRTLPTRVTIEEKLHGEELLTTILEKINPSDVVTSSSAVWNKDELRIFMSDEEDEEELELELVEIERPEETKDLKALARKRKSELDDAAADEIHKINAGTPPSFRPDRCQRPVHKSSHWRGRVSSQSPPSQSQLRALNPHHPGHATVTRSKTSQKSKDSDRSLMFGGKFSASDALENFMAIQGISVGPPQAKQDNERIDVQAPAPTTTLPVHSIRTVRGGASASPRADIEPGHTGQPLLLPPCLPSIPKDLPPSSFIMSSALLQQRSLSKQIEKLYSNAEFVSRDFELPHSVAKEADLLLSPSTGLVITTLQQLKQRALPGQPDRSPIKERILSLHYRYERLVIMVTEGLNTDLEEYASSRLIDARDQEAMKELRKFALQMEGEVLVKYVPGGEQALALSVVGEMALYGLPHGSKDIGDIKPLPDETNVCYTFTFLSRILTYPSGSFSFAAQA
jgi:hypothetical protein